VALWQLRKALAALEQRVGALEPLPAPLVVSDEAFDGLQAMIKQDQEAHATPDRPTQPPAVPDALLAQIAMSCDVECDLTPFGAKPPLAIRLFAEKAIAWAHAQREEEVREAEQRGADAELEACCQWLLLDPPLTGIARELRESRRPAPPTLREQALAALRERLTDPGVVMSGENRETMELALQALQEGADG
jgi:hypothetical protein